jgi:tetratricopeptide (TPR) repeat protein
MTLLDNLAYQYESSGNFNDAIRAREQQLIIETRNWRVYYFLGLDLIKIEQFEKLDSIMKKIDSLTLFMNSEEKSEWTQTKADWIKFVE